MDTSGSEAAQIRAAARQDACGVGGLLSLREREVLVWLASGLRTAEIAHLMNIKPVTVGLHLQGARRKLNARTREQALAIALRDGHIMLPPVNLDSLSGLGR